MVVLPSGDALRASIIAVINAFFPMLTILGIVDWSAEQLAAVSVFVTTVVAMVFLFYKGGTAPTGGA